MTKLVVTGGAGYLGSEVASQAVTAGWDVVATQLRRDAPSGRPLALDLADADAVELAFARERPDVVIHTAYRQAEESLARDVVESTASVVRAAVAAGARLVHLSTDMVFGGKRTGRYDERDEPRPVSAYGLAKLEVERLVLAEHPNALVVRTSLLYGMSGPQEALAVGHTGVFYTDEVRTPIHVADLAAALLELAVSDTTGTLHVAGPDAVNRYEFARLLAARQGHDLAHIRGAPLPPGAARARNIALDSSRAVGLLTTRIPGVREVLRGPG